MYAHFWDCRPFHTARRKQERHQHSHWPGPSITRCGPPHWAEASVWGERHRGVTRTHHTSRTTQSANDWLMLVWGQAPGGGGDPRRGPAPGCLGGCRRCWAPSWRSSEGRERRGNRQKPWLPGRMDGTTREGWGEGDQPPPPRKGGGYSTHPPMHFAS